MEQNSIFCKCDIFFLLKGKIKEEWLSSLTQSLHPSLLPQSNGTDAGKAAIISLPVLCYSRDSSILQPTQNTVFWEQQVGLTFHWGKWLFVQLTIFLGQEWLSKQFLPDSHSFRIYWHNLFIICILTEDHHLKRILQGAGGILIMMAGALKKLSPGKEGNIH